MTEVIRTEKGNITKKVKEVRLTKRGVFNSGGSTKRIFSDFLIIGLTETDAIKDKIVVHPKILYNYLKYDESDQKRLETVKDFCFPQGITLEKISNDSGQIEQCLYSQLPFRVNSFNFTLNNTDEAKGEDYLNFICLVVNSLVPNPETG